MIKLDDKVNSKIWYENQCTFFNQTVKTMGSEKKNVEKSEEKPNNVLYLGFSFPLLNEFTNSFILPFSA